MNAVLWQWPPQTRVTRTVPKSKFYEAARVSGRIREAFVSDVERIIWAHKLSPQTLPLAGTATVPEIQVFTVEAKSEREVSGAVLDVIDAAVQTPVVFEEYADGAVRTRASGKFPGVKGGHKLSGRFDGKWLDTSAPRSALPTALDLEGLYALLLAPLLPLDPRPGESLSDVLGRIEQAQALERLVKGLESRMASEKQLNRKLEIRRELLERAAELEALAGPATR